MRIGLVAPLPPQVGGVASVAGWLLDHQELLECEYATFDLRRPPGETMGGRLRLHSIPRQLVQLARFIGWVPRAPKVIHFCVSASRTGLPRDALYILLLRVSRRRTIAHVHGSGLAIATESRFRSPFLRLIGRMTSERVAISRISAGVLAGAGIPSRCILNPIRFEPETVRGARGNGKPLELLFVGAYGRRKGCPELIDAVARLRDRGLDVRLRIVGNEDQKGDGEVVESKVRAHGLNGVVEFAGIKAAEEMPSSYSQADVICLPSRHEGLPMALLEAMAFGLPVVSTPVGGIPDLVLTGETGLLVAPGDVEALTEAIATLAADPELRRRMGAAGRERVFALAGTATIAEQWRDLYRELEGSRNHKELVATIQKAGPSRSDP